MDGYSSEGHTVQRVKSCLLHFVLNRKKKDLTLFSPFRREHEVGHGRGVLERGPGHLGRVGSPHRPRSLLGRCFYPYFTYLINEYALRVFVAR
jgi:hypothetical protein